jgi:isopenicillin N synthase-like dioxygenase
MALPIIDVSGLLNGSASAGAGASAVADVGAKIARACEETGFFLIEGHGVSPELRARIFEENARFNGLPLERKIEIKLSPAFRGYQPFAGSTLKISTVEEATVGNQSESFFIRHDISPEDAAGEVIAGPNLWPRDLPGFQETVQAYHDVMRELALSLLPAWAYAMEQDEAEFSTLFDPPSTILRLLHYPAHERPRESGVYGIAPHTDYGFMTILAQDEIGGLELCPVDEDWQAVPAIADTFVVNTGDTVPLLTGGRFASTRHRVVNTSATESRYSVPFFLDPSFNATIKPLPGFDQLDDAGSVRFGDYLLKRLETNYPDRVRA